MQNRTLDLLIWKIYNISEAIAGAEELMEMKTEKLCILTYSMGTRSNCSLLYTIKKAVSMEYDVEQVEWRMYGCATCQSWFVAISKTINKLALLVRPLQESEAKEDRSQSIM